MVLLKYFPWFFQSAGPFFIISSCDVNELFVIQCYKISRCDFILINVQFFFPFLCLHGLFILMWFFVVCFWNSFLCIMFKTMPEVVPVALLRCKEWNVTKNQFFFPSRKWLIIKRYMYVNQIIREIRVVFLLKIYAQMATVAVW